MEWCLPGWLGDLLPILSLSAQMCHPLSLAEGKKLLCMVLLLPGATDEAMTVATNIVSMPDWANGHCGINSVLQVLCSLPTRRGSNAVAASLTAL